MKMKLATVALGAAVAASPALADLTFTALSYRTGPYAANGIPFADGYADYFTLLNERDGGIGGEMIELIECETGYNTEKGVALTRMSHHVLSAPPRAQNIAGGATTASRGSAKRELRVGRAAPKGFRSFQAPMRRSPPSAWITGRPL